MHNLIISLCNILLQIWSKLSFWYMNLLYLQCSINFCGPIVEDWKLLTAQFLKLFLNRFLLFIICFCVFWWMLTYFFCMFSCSCGGYFAPEDTCLTPLMLLPAANRGHLGANAEIFEVLFFFFWLRNEYLWSFTNDLVNPNRFYGFILLGGVHCALVFWVRNKMVC